MSVFELWGTFVRATPVWIHSSVVLTNSRAKFEWLHKLWKSNDSWTFPEENENLPWDAMISLERKNFSDFCENWT